MKQPPLISHMRSIGDLQVCVASTAAEFLEIMDRQFESVALPTWKERVSEAELNPSTMYMFNLGLDKGGDNVLGMAVVKTQLSGTANVAMHAQWCWFHGTHKIVEDSYKMLDAFKWDFEGNEALELPVLYFNGLKICSNTWNSTGTRRKLESSATAEYNGFIAHTKFKAAIGRCIKQRWSSGHAVEERIDTCAPYIGKVVARTFRRQGHDGGVVPNAVDPDDEDAHFKIQQGRWRRLFVGLANNPTFLGMIRISVDSQAPTKHAFAWAYKRNKESKKLATIAEQSGEAPLTGNFISDFVEGKAIEISGEFDKLLEADGSLAEETFPVGMRADGRALFVGLVLQQQANWQWRVCEPCERFPLRLLHMVRTIPDVVCDHRRECATAWLAADPADLEGSATDVALKLRGKYRIDIEYCARTGKCARSLYGALVMWRGKLPPDTHEPEGMNNVV